MIFLICLFQNKLHDLERKYQLQAQKHNELTQEMEQIRVEAEQAKTEQVRTEQVRRELEQLQAKQRANPANIQVSENTQKTVT